MTPAPLTPAVFHILLALAEGPLHGYAIMQSVEESSGMAMGPGTIYGTLERLESSGFVKELPAARTTGAEPLPCSRPASLPSGRRPAGSRASRRWCARNGSCMRSLLFDMRHGVRALIDTHDAAATP